MNATTTTTPIASETYRNDATGETRVLSCVPLKYGRHEVILDNGKPYGKIYSNRPTVEHAREAWAEIRAELRTAGFVRVVAPTPKPIDVPETVDALTIGDACQHHGAPTVKEYDFGRYASATLYSYRCGCCGVIENDVMADHGQLYPSYSAAEGRARMIAAIHHHKYRD